MLSVFHTEYRKVEANKVEEFKLFQPAQIKKDNEMLHYPFPIIYFFNPPSRSIALTLKL